jgi:hypothetical protein
LKIETAAFCCFRFFCGKVFDFKKLCFRFSSSQVVKNIRRENQRRKLEDYISGKILHISP